MINLDIFDRVNGLPIWAQIIIYIIVCGIVVTSTVLAFYNPILEFYSLIKDRSHKKDKNKKSEKIDTIQDYESIREKVLNSRLMHEIIELRTKLPTYNFGDKNRNRIFTFILESYMKSIEDNVFKLIDTYDIDNLNEDKFIRVIHSMSNDIINELQTKVKLKYGKKIYDLVMLDPNKGMRAWTRYLDEQSQILIDEFSRSNQMVTNHQKFVIILTSLATSLIVISTNIEKRFYNFNGELTELLKEEYGI